RKIEHEMRQRARVVEREKLTAEDFAKRLESVTLTIPMRVGEEERLYGSVTAQMLSDGLERQGFDVDRRSIVLDEPIRTLGSHDVSVRLRHGVSGTFRVNVVAEEGQRLLLFVFIKAQGVSSVLFSRITMKSE